MRKANGRGIAAAVRARRALARSACQILVGVTKQVKGEPVSFRRRVRFCFYVKKVDKINQNRHFHSLRVSIFHLYIEEIDFIRKIW